MTVPFTCPACAADLVRERLASGVVFSRAIDLQYTSVSNDEPISWGSRCPDCEHEWPSDMMVLTLRTIANLGVLLGGTED